MSFKHSLFRATLSFFVFALIFGIGLFFRSQAVGAFGILGQKADYKETLTFSIEDKIDRDGDGRYSELKVKVEGADTIDESGKTSTGVNFKPLGESKWVFRARTESGKEVILGIKDGFDGAVYDKEDIFSLKSVYVEDREFKRLVFDEPITSMRAQWYESDSSFNEVTGQDTFIDEVKLRDLDIKMEGPNSDQKVNYNLETNVKADVYKIQNGQKTHLGQTSDIKKTDYGPESTMKIEWPKDIRRDGRVYLQLEKEGYQKERFRVMDAKKMLPDQKSVNMEKEMKPVVIKSSPGEARISINGSDAGQTSQMFNLWSKKFPLNIKIEKSGYKTKTYKDVKPESIINAELEKKDQETTSTSSSGDEFGDFTSIGDYSLGETTELPSLSLNNIQSIVDTIPNLSSYSSSDFTYTPKKIEAGNEILFDAGSSFNLSSSITSFNWDFGDGETGTGKNVEHVYDNSGKYKVKLETKDANNNVDTITKTIDVKNNEPNANFVVDNSNPEINESITFESNADDIDGNIVSYKWDFGDGNTDSGKLVSHSFDNTGSFAVKLIVEDNDGATDTITKTVRVLNQNQKPKANFSFSPQSAKAGEKLSFNGSGSVDADGSINGYTWIFGDGQTGKGKKVSHKYKTKGEYKVVLSIVDDRGARDSIFKKINVSEADNISNDNDDSTNKSSESENAEKQDSSKNKTNKPLSQNTTCTLTPNKSYTHPDTNTVWRITPRGTKQPFQSSRMFKTWYDSYDPIEETTKQKIEDCKDDKAGFVPLGPKAKEQGLMKGGTLVKVTSDPKVYLLLDGKRYWITSEDVFNKLNYNWNWIQDGSMQLVNSFKKEGEINNINQHKEGSLIKYPSSNKVYKLEKNNQGQMVKRHIKNEQVFDRLGYRFDRVVTIDESETYPDGSVLR